MNYPHRPLAAFLLLAASLPLGAQVAPANPTPNASPAPIAEEETITLTPFEVKAGEDNSYIATNTLAGNRLNTELRDIGASVSIITKQFMQDINATGNASLLQYTLGTEVGTIQGNFAGVGDSPTLDESNNFKNPNTNTRVRGLATADNSRDYFLSNVPWDSYNVETVELQRGPNSILFGQGSPAGIINTTLREARFKNSAEIEQKFDSQGTHRTSLDINRVLIKDELALRLSALNNNQEFKQKPAFSDDERIFGSVRWEPKFLKIGSARTVIKGSIETGDIDSNNPRSLPPIDLITPWFQTGTFEGAFIANGVIRDPVTGVVRTVKAGDVRVFNGLNRRTFNPHQLQDDNTGRPNQGQARTNINGGPDVGFFSPFYQPDLGNFGQQFGGAIVSPQGIVSANSADFFVSEIRTNRGIGPNGLPDNGIGGFAFNRPAGIATQAQFARNAGLPFAQFGVYKDNNLTDASIFDFNNTLLDGQNKREWQNFTRYNFSVAQTFMHDKFGVELNVNHEDYRNGQLALLSGNRQAINIDVNNALSDGTAAGGTAKNGIPFSDGTPNPNVGRAFITDSGQGGNNSFKSDNDNFRVTGFLNHDFSKGQDKGWLSRFLGRHTLTGLYSEDNVKTDNRNWERFAILDPAYAQALSIPANTRFNDNLFAVNRVIYLGPTLLNNATAAGIGLPGPDVVFPTSTLTSANIRYFDSTWAGNGVDPAAPWFDNRFLPGDARGNSTQAENPANYVGWVTKNFQVTDSEASPANRDQLTTTATLAKSKVDTKAFVWQAHFWDNAIVASYGYRRDHAQTFRKKVDANSNPGRGFNDLSPVNYKLPDAPETNIRATSETYSIVGHLDQFPLLGRLTEKLPVAISLAYNDSQNFQAASSRVDILGNPISAPQGDTIEKGLLLETRDGRYSFKVNRYKTRLKNATSSALNGAWFIGASQAWSGQWVNIFQFNLSGNDISTANGPNAGRYTYSPAAGETQANADQREAAAIAAWRGWQAKVATDFPGFYEAWNIKVDDLKTAKNGITSSTPNGFAVTEDSISKGWEFELNAQPTRNWRVSVNATKTTAIRNNIGGTALSDFMSAYSNFLRTTAGGDLRIWWGGAGNETSLFQFNQNIGGEFTSRKLQEGTAVPEIRQWRVNAVSSYDFDRGFLRGVTVGGGLRWQDNVTIGFPPVTVPNDPTQVSFDLSAPFQGGTEANVDLWVGYGRRFYRDKIDWRIQLNVTNVGKNNGLIAITAQPDGTPAGYRIAPRQEWTITNTFKF